MKDLNYLTSNTFYVISKIIINKQNLKEKQN